MSTPDDTPGFWAWIPIVRDPNVTEQLSIITNRLDEIMALVKVEQADLDALDQALDAATTALADKINALNLPDADLAALQEDLTTLQNLGAPAVVEEPPA